MLAHKFPRLASAEEMDQISAAAWGEILGKHARAAPAAAPEPVAVAVAVGETVRLLNCDAHRAFSEVHLELFPERAAAKEAVAAKTSEHRDDASSTSSSDDDDEERVVVAVPRPEPLPPAQRLKPSQYYARFIARTPEQCAAELEAPQRSQAWLDARKPCITASQFGAAVGESPYQSPDALVADKLWNTFQGNAMTAWGTEHEPHAKEAFCAWFKLHLQARGLCGDFTFREENLLKFADEPWVGVSPDGIVEYDDEQGVRVTELVEFKCPAVLRNTARHPYAKWPRNTPSYYYAQVQGIMGYLNAHHPRWAFQRCWFVVWQPHQTWVTLLEYDDAYYNRVLHSGLQKWYFTNFLPRLAHKHNGLLAFGETEPLEPIVVQPQ